MKSNDDNFCLETRWQQILEKISTDGPSLLRSSSVVTKQARGRRVWVLRFRARLGGKVRHRCIYLGADDNGELRRRVRAWLEARRQQGQWLRQLSGFAQLAARLNRLGRQFSHGPLWGTTYV